MLFLIKSVLTFSLIVIKCESVTINSPRVLLPYVGVDERVSYQFQVENSGCYKWSISSDDALSLSPCASRCCDVATVTVIGLPLESIIVTATDLQTGVSVSSNVDIRVISSLEIRSATRDLFLDEHPEAFALFASDEFGNGFSTLESISFGWRILNPDTEEEDYSSFGFVDWRDTSFACNEGTLQLEANGLRGASVLVVSTALGSARLAVSRGALAASLDIHSNVAVRLVPSVAVVAPYDLIRFSALRMMAGLWSPLDIGEGSSSLEIESGESGARVEGTVGVRGGAAGTSAQVNLVGHGGLLATALLHFDNPTSLEPRIRNGGIFSFKDTPILHVKMLDPRGRVMLCGSEILIHTHSKEARIDEVVANGSLATVKAPRPGPVRIHAHIHSIAGVRQGNKVEGNVTAFAVEPPFVAERTVVAWCGASVSFKMSYSGGSGKPVVWTYRCEDGAIRVDSVGSVEVARVGVASVRACVAGSSVCSDGVIHVVAARRLRLMTPRRPQPTNKPVRLNVEIFTELGIADVCSCESINVDTLDGYAPEELFPLTEHKPSVGDCCAMSGTWSKAGVVDMRATCRGVEPAIGRVLIRVSALAAWPKFALALPLHHSLPLFVVPPSTRLHSRIAGRATLKHLEDRYIVTCTKVGEAPILVVDEDETQTDFFNLTCVDRVDSVTVTPTPMPDCGEKLYVTKADPLVLSARVEWGGLRVLTQSDQLLRWTLEPQTPEASLELIPEEEVSHDAVQASTRTVRAGGLGDVDVVLSALNAVTRLRLASIAKLSTNSFEVDVLLSAGDEPLEVAQFEGGSGRLLLRAPQQLKARLEGNSLLVTASVQGDFHVTVIDKCVEDSNIRILVRVQSGEQVRVVRPTELVVGRCATPEIEIYGHASNPLKFSQIDVRYEAEGAIHLREGLVCGEYEGPARIRARFDNIWGPYKELHVHSELKVVPSESWAALGARVSLWRSGGGRGPCEWHSPDPQLRVDPKSGRAFARAHGMATVVVECGHFSAQGIVNVVQVTEASIEWSCRSLLVGGVCVARARAGPLDLLHLRSHSAQAQWRAEGLKLSRAPDLEKEEGGGEADGLVIHVRATEAGTRMLQLTLEIPGAGSFSASLSVEVEEETEARLTEDDSVLPARGSVLAARGAKLFVKGPKNQLYQANTATTGVETIVVESEEGPPAVVAVLVVEPKYLTTHYDETGIWWSVRDEWGRSLRGFEFSARPRLTLAPPTAFTPQHPRPGRISFDDDPNATEEAAAIFSVEEGDGVRGWGSIEDTRWAMLIGLGGAVCSPRGVHWMENVGLQRLSDDLLVKVVAPFNVELERPLECGVTGSWTAFPLSMGDVLAVACSREQLALATTRGAVSPLCSCSVPAPHVARTLLLLYEGEPRLACELMPASAGWVELSVTIGNTSATHKVNFQTPPEIIHMPDGKMEIRGSARLLADLRAVTSPLQTATLRYSGGLRATLSLEPQNCGENWVELRGCGWAQRVVFEGEPCKTLLHHVSVYVVTLMAVLFLMKGFFKLTMLTSSVRFVDPTFERTPSLPAPTNTTFSQSWQSTRLSDQSGSSVYGASDPSFNESVSRSRRRFI